MGGSEQGRDPLPVDRSPREKGWDSMWGMGIG